MTIWQNFVTVWQKLVTNWQKLATIQENPATIWQKPAGKRPAAKKTLATPRPRNLFSVKCFCI